MIELRTKAESLIRSKRHHIVYFSFIILFLVSSCSQQATFMQSSVVPAAHGKVKVKKDDNRNYKIDVEITDLAEVEKVYSRNFSYIVWMETDEGEIKNLGKLISSKGFFSGQRKAELETVSTFEPIRVFVTAERDMNTLQPGSRVILRTRSF